MERAGKIPIGLVAAAAAAAGLLSGCSPMTTYGTGVTPGTQTMRDIAGVVSLKGINGNSQQIDYEPRAGIVTPPNNALPPPGDNPTQNAANWPTDPEKLRRQVQQQADAARAEGNLNATTYDPGIRVASRQREEEDALTGTIGDNLRRAQAAGNVGPTGTPKKSGRGGSVDESGTPVRKYLVEPPTVYREPSPDSPVEVVEQPKSKNKQSLWSRLWPF